MNRPARPVPSPTRVPAARRVLPILLVLPALLVLGAALTSWSAADSAGPSPKTPLQVTYYFLPG
ncbi:MAG TPA: hypothetical protein VFB49_12825 [Patescibacteria group bacterium]|nr:hypothetical protein [Patescibacteria group bacterium]